MRRLPRVVIIAATFAAVGISSQGCADNESGLYVQAVLKLDAPQCVAKADASSTVLLGGVMDLAFTESYFAALLVGNQLTRRGSRDQVRTETSRITLRGAEVDVLNDSQQLIKSFSVPGTGFVDPGGGDEPGYGVMSVQLLYPGLGLTAGTRVTTEVRVFGDTLGGDEITSASLTFPITVCNGCLVSYPLEADDPASAGYLCTVGDSASSIDAPCRYGQDDPVDCRLCAGTMPICQAPP
jgi:hypothetical protein